MTHFCVGPYTLPLQLGSVAVHTGFLIHSKVNQRGEGGFWKGADLTKDKAVGLGSRYMGDRYPGESAVQNTQCE